MFRAMSSRSRSVTPPPRCWTCRGDFKDEQEFLSHECEYECSTCAKVFGSRLELIRHLVYVEKKNTILCDACAHFSSQASGEDKSKICDQCNHMVKLNTKLHLPLRKKKMEHPYKCDGCDKLFLKVCMVSNSVPTTKEVDMIKKEAKRLYLKRQEKIKRHTEKMVMKELKREARRKRRSEQNDVAISVEPSNPLNDESGSSDSNDGPSDISTTENNTPVVDADDNSEVANDSTKPEKVLQFVVRYVEVPAEVPIRSGCFLVNFYRKYDVLRIFSWLCLFVIPLSAIFAIVAITCGGLFLNHEQLLILDQ